MSKKIQDKIIVLLKQYEWVLRNQVPRKAGVGRTSGFKNIDDMIDDEILETTTVDPQTGKNGRAVWVKLKHLEKKQLSRFHQLRYDFLAGMLTNAIKEIEKHKKPLFSQIEKKVEAEAQLLPLFDKNTGKKSKIMRQIVRGVKKDFEPRTIEIKKDLDALAMYTDDVIIRIAQEQYAIAMDFANKSESKESLKSYEEVLRKHLGKLLKMFPEEKYQIKTYFRSSVRRLEFKI